MYMHMYMYMYVCMYVCFPSVHVVSLPVWHMTVITPRSVCMGRGRDPISLALTFRKTNPEESGRTAEAFRMTSHEKEANGVSFSS